MRILCNLPLECFDDRAAMPGIDLLTYGPADRMQVDGRHFPFDVACDPSRESWQDLLARLPHGWRPDLVLVYWPDQEPLPAGLEQCAVPVVGVVSDYNLSLPQLAGLWPFFDLLLCDRAGVALFERLSFAAVRYWNQYAHKRPFHRLLAPIGDRPLDVGFAGNLNPIVQAERAPWLQRLARLQHAGVQVALRSGIVGDDYARFLNQCRIGWNRSIRGELNLRAFEVPACGALLLLERSNREVADFFVPGEECVLYDDDLEAVALELLGNPNRLARIAAAGHRRVQDHRLGPRLGQLATSLASLRVQRPASTPFERALGRATAMLLTWATPAAKLAAALAAHQQDPSDPRALNLLGVASLQAGSAAAAHAAARLWQTAAASHPGYLPAAVNLRSLARAAGDPGLLQRAETEVSRRSAVSAWQELDGAVVPIGYDRGSIGRSQALREAVLAGSPQAYASSLVAG